jgi:hypothetical protein
MFALVPLVHSNMPVKFHKEEIDTLKRLVAGRQEAMSMLKLFSIVTGIYQRLEYPITSFSDFIKKLEREEGSIKRLNEDEISIGSEVVKINCVKRIIPAYYFPMSNSEDLQDKAAELYSKKIAQFNLSGVSSGTESELPSKLKEIPAEEIPPFPEKFKNIKHKPRKPGAVIETIETEDVA